MFASLPRFTSLLMSLTFLFLIASFASAQDLRGGAALVFVQHPRNPLVRQKSEHSINQRRGQSMPASGRVNLDNSPFPQSTHESTDAVEDALALGNSARDTKPPRYKDSEKAYKLAAKLNPKDPRPYIGLANIWYDQKNYEEAAQMYRRAALLASSVKAIRGPDFNRPSGRGGAVTTATTTAVASTPVQVTLDRDTGVRYGEVQAFLGNSLLQRSKFSEAEVELKNATREDPDNAEWQALLGFSLFKQKKYAEASQALKNAVLLAPENARYKEMLKKSESREKTLD
ncbi:MAG: tetratricopeptide repeat protein [Pyrinomonadaceae bacterium]